MFKIGLQLFTLRNEIEKYGIEDVMKKCKIKGYEFFELSCVSLDNDSINSLVNIVDKLDVEISAITYESSFLLPQKDIDEFNKKIINVCQRLGCKYVRIGMIDSGYTSGRGKYIEYAKKIDKTGEVLKEHGIKLYYHNHHVEFELFNNQTGLEILAQYTNKDNVGFELDVHWLQRGGAIPSKIINELSGRVDLIHLKDYKIVTNQDSNKLVEIEFAPVGSGTLDMVDIINTSIKSEVKYFFVEQDDTYGKDPYIEIGRSYDYLSKIGYKENFKK